MWKLWLVLSLAAVSAEVHAQAPPSPVRLAVVIVVDQMRPDYVDRFADLYTGGLARLLHEGTYFDRAYHDHSCTFTGPGHATLSTGSLPAHHGIVANDWFERATGREVGCCSDTSVAIVHSPELEGVSPRWLLRPTVAEYFRRQYPGARVVSLALKDRAAVFLAGRQADAVFWYEEKPGRFVTSSWYANSTPSWVSDLQPFIAGFADSTWTRLLADSAYRRSGPDLVPSEHDGVNTQFPHPGNPAGGAPGPASDRELFYLPYGDRVVLELARRAAAALQLGQDSIPDLLLLSCSAADAIGHRYGPGSQEMQDYYLRLDRYLGELFDDLDRFVGANRWFVALASDHGVASLPEADAARGLPARRVPTDTVRAQIKRLASEVDEATGVSLGVSQVEDGLAFAPEVWMDSARARAAGLDLAARLRSLDWVADVYTRWELSDPGITDRPYMSLFRNALHPDRGADLFVREKEGVLVTSRKGGTTHGSVYSYDTHVPLFFMGPGIGSARISDSVRTVDLAPTLCDCLGVPTAGRFDGVSLATRLKR